MKTLAIALQVLYAALAIFFGFVSYGLYAEHAPWWSVVANAFVSMLFAFNAVGHRVVIERKRK